MLDPLQVTGEVRVSKDTPQRDVTALQDTHRFILGRLEAVRAGRGPAEETQEPVTNGT